MSPWNCPPTRFPMVPVDSSAARIPFPGAMMRCAVSINSSAYLPAYALPEFRLAIAAYLR